MTDLRQDALKQWLRECCKLPACTLQPLAGDASFRRYFRITQPNCSYIAMDAPPLRESCASFVAISQGLQALGLHTPTVFASDLTQGFLLLSDFGDRLYLKELNQANAKPLYTKALDALAILQSCRHIEGMTIPLFTFAFMRQELELFKEWFLHHYLEIAISPATETALADCFDFLVTSAVNQPQVFMHRDFHSANLMLLPDGEVGILDFQDAFIGPVTYDVVSLLRDCYIAWPDAFVKEMVLYYRSQIALPVSETEFLIWFDLMGLQRHLKALLTFSRKCKRDHDDRYLKHIPRTVNYILRVSERYPECQALYQLMSEIAVCAQ